MVQWRNGNAAVCKTVMSRLDTGLHLFSIASVNGKGSGFLNRQSRFKSSRDLYLDVTWLGELSRRGPVFVC
jgi:hypothetical protein